MTKPRNHFNHTQSKTVFFQAPRQIVSHLVFLVKFTKSQRHSSLQIRVMTLLVVASFSLFCPCPCRNKHSFCVQRRTSLLERITTLAERCSSSQTTYTPLEGPFYVINSHRAAGQGPNKLPYKTLIRQTALTSNPNVRRLIPAKQFITPNVWRFFPAALISENFSIFIRSALTRAWHAHTSAQYVTN